MKYAFIDDFMTWYDANSYCNSTFGGRLAVAKKSESFIGVQEATRANQFWVGARHTWEINENRGEEGWLWFGDESCATSSCASGSSFIPQFMG
mmetsp:Transcript_1263/g.2249  ORF Transcript_1263/g.2249 Transcript_1263/m.2249 type:complete len:93 (+) Transcript_1263:231-509(+)